MRIIICLLLLTSTCYGDVVLHRFYETATGNEMGLSYSSKDGIPAISNPGWTVQVISESQKEYYRKEHRKQIKARQKIAKDELKAKRKVIKDKLKAGDPLSQQDVDLLVGESD